MLHEDTKIGVHAYDMLLAKRSTKIRVKLEMSTVERIDTANRPCHAVTKRCVQELADLQSEDSNAVLWLGFGTGMGFG